MTTDETATHRAHILGYWKDVDPDIHDGYAAYYAAEDAEAAARQRARSAWDRVNALVEQRLYPERQRITATMLPAH